MFEAWSIQRRVIGALLMREVITRYGRNNIGFLWLFVEPLIFTLGVTALWTATQSVHGSSLPIVAFAMTGYSSVLIWRNMPSRCIGAVEPNLSLMYHRQVKIIDIFAARVVLEACGASISFVVLGVLYWFFGWVEPPENVLTVILGWTMLIWFGVSLGILLGSLAEMSDLVEKLWHPASYLLFPLSGAAFMVDALPKTAQNVVLLLPMVHGVELVREGYFGSAVHARYDIGYMTLCCLGLSLFALASLQIISRKVIPE